MRKIRRHSAKTQYRLIMLSVISIMLVLTVGYAAFQTNISLNVKGNIKKSNKASFGGIKVPIITTGDGLYEDKDPDNKDIYVYKGANPNNYINVGSDLYRIMEVDSIGNIKVIKDTPLPSMIWDPGYNSNISGITSSSSTAGTRYSSSSSDYCYASSGSSYYGCKSWGSSSSTLNSAGNSNVTQMPLEAGSSILYNLPTYDSYINVYLNGGEYPTTNGTTTLTSWYSSNVASNLQSKIVDHLWNVGPVSSSNYTLVQSIGQEAAYKWRGKIGLMTATDYVRASTNSACAQVHNYYTTPSCYTNSSTHNWLHKNTTSAWTMSPYSTSHAYDVLYAMGTSPNMPGALSEYDARYDGYDIRPAFYLSSDTILTGNGTSSSPYIAS